MLFAISSPQGAGKTTILRHIEQLGYDVVQRKTSRSILAEWGVTLSEVNNDRPLTVKFQEEILKRKFEDDHTLAIDDHIHFCERSFVDLWIYNLVALGKDNEYSDFVNEYYTQCRKHQQMYTKVFYLTMTPPVIENDGVRAINPLYNDMINTLMHRYLMLWDPMQNETINELDHQERMNRITTTLSKYENPAS